MSLISLQLAGEYIMDEYQNFYQRKLYSIIQK